MATSRANGVDIHYEIAGDGPAMVLVHAIPFDHSLWLYQQARFSTWFRVISVDLRGFGRSAKVTAAYAFEDMARDVLGVMDDEGVDRAVVMGCSIGSKLALLLGGFAPQRFSAIIQVGGNSGPQDFARRIDGYLNEPFSPYRRAHLRFGNREGFGDTPLGRYLHDMFSERDPWHDPAAIAAVFRALSAGDARPYLSAYKPPTLIINGEFDNARPRGEETARLIPGARHRILAGAGHACMIEDPAGFDALVIDFLRDHGLMPDTR
jgi:pimeloyl-[acyl-carrier protein] methyl ester esterase